ncbi:MAG: nicotinamide mononucleotide deamidase-related protein [Actinomycetota bacterium]
MKTAEIFSIGDELLRGIVADTNSHWMAKRIAARGASLTRITTLPDDPAIVADALNEALAREPALICTQGGLGPTDDDRTREAIARGTGLALTHHPGAEAIVRRRYESLFHEGRIPDAQMTPERLRMSALPVGAQPLNNEIGGAPGILLRHRTSTIVCLPGVPPELWWIWENSLTPYLDSILGPGGFAETTVVLTELDESRIAATLQRIASRHPHVYVKSRATAFDQPDPRVRLTLTAAGASDADARWRVDAAFADAASARARLDVRAVREDPSAGPSTSGRNAIT